MIHASVARSIFDVAAIDWDACAQGRPFLRHAFFAALEHSGAVGPGRQIVPAYLLLRDDAGRLMACAPAMFKTGTLAEYGPEYRWLRAGLAAGLFAWPKFQVGVPLYPVRGPKLLVRDGEPREPLEKLLVHALERFATSRADASMLNVMQVDEEQARRLERAGWLLSSETHGFWRNPGYVRFEDYLAALPHRKRYALLKERRQFADLGYAVRILRGEEITRPLLDRHHEGHVAVCARYGNHPWLPRALYGELTARMAQCVRMIAAFEGDDLVASIFCLQDRDTLYLRTWSAVREAPALCLELVCHRPIEYAIEQGLAEIDSGLSGTHKRHRGYIDEPVFSAHRFFDDRLRELALRVIRGASPAGHGDARAPEPAPPTTARTRPPQR
ncbi:MAG: hypothetical protein RIS35_707 [Pseudomonadota bacterium]|jgi:predicted N-acyltransferase